MKKFLLNRAVLDFCIILLTGCNGTLDLTKDHIGAMPFCELHHCQMEPEYIYVTGEIIYTVEYAEICRKEFPNHGGHRYNRETESTPSYKDVVDFVCPECDTLYYLYWKNTRKVEVKASD